MPAGGVSTLGAVKGICASLESRLAPAGGIVRTPVQYMRKAQPETTGKVTLTAISTTSLRAIEIREISCEQLGRRKLMYGFGMFGKFSCSVGKPGLSRFWGYAGYCGQPGYAPAVIWQLVGGQA